MKSKLFILFIAIIGIFYASFNNIKTEASILEEPMRMASRLDSFNTIKGYISDDFFEEDHDYDQYNFAISRFIESGYLEAYIEGYVDSLEVTIKEKVYFLDGFLI
nr:hypothetical protein [Acholeplasmatales bacterium]